MTLACVIWADPRTGSSALFDALAAAIPGDAYYEPFQYGPDAREYAGIYEQWCLDGDPTALYRFIGRRALIKHIPEAFDRNFNADLARAAEYHGYRHIHLIRCNTFAKLLSRGIAQQLDAWLGLPEDIAAGDIAPLDVPHLIADLRLDAARWAEVSTWMTAVLTVKTEDLTSPHRLRRHACLRRIARYLETPFESLSVIDAGLARGAQHTARIAGLIPNLNELRAALMIEGAA